MKKLLYSIMALAGLTMASCTQEHIDVQYIPENAVAPVLGDIQGCELAEDGADIVVEYTKADFGVATAQAHNLYISTSETMEGMKKAKATFGDTTITLKQADLNIAALDFADAGAEVDFYFAIVANLNTDKGAAVAGTELKSNVVKATFKSYVADVLPVEKYGKMYVVGTLNGWDHAAVEKEYDFLYNYDAGNANLFAGIIDLREPNSAAEFKFTNGAWGDKEHSMDGAQDAEATTVRLVAGGGDNVNVWQTKRFYGAELDLGGTTLKKLWSADQIGVIGLNGDWENDIVMEYNAKWARFYVDIEATGDTEMKFRADAGWDLNWGAGCANGGDNIAVAAGKYRVYFNPVSGLIEFSASKYGTQEDTAANGGTEPEPTPTEKVYGLVGTINGWGGSADIVLAAHNGDWVAYKNFTVTADDQFKVRVNSDWGENYGAEGEVEPFVLATGETYTLVGNGKNMAVADGSYDVYFNTATAEFVMVEAGAADPTLPSDAKGVKLYADVRAAGWDTCNLYSWGDLGDFAGGWPGSAMTLEGDYYVWAFDATAYGKSINVVLNNGNGDQTVDITAIVLDADVMIVLTDNEGGKWNATLNGETPAEPEKPAVTTYGLIGDFNGWGGDVELAPRGDGWFVAVGVAMEGKFLIRFNGAWDEKFGFAADNTYAVIGENALTYGGADMWINAGTYDFYLNPTTAKMFVANAGDEDPTAGLVASISYGLVGTINGWAAPDVKFEAIGDGGYKLLGYTLAATEQIKIRANEEWNDAENYGLASAGVLTTNAANTLICGGGSANMSVAADGTYDFYFYPAELTLYVMEAGQTPQR